MDKTTRFKTYGPPNHRVNQFQFRIVEQEDNIELMVVAFSPTKNVPLYRCHLELGIDPTDEHAHLILGQVLTTITEDLWQQRPNTEARCYFVMGGGLYEQTEFEF